MKIHQVMVTGWLLTVVVLVAGERHQGRRHHHHPPPHHHHLHDLHPHHCHNGKPPRPREQSAGDGTEQDAINSWQAHMEYQVIFLMISFY